LVVTARGLPSGRVTVTSTSAVSSNWPGAAKGGPAQAGGDEADGDAVDPLRLSQLGEVPARAGAVALADGGVEVNAVGLKEPVAVAGLAVFVEN
jgi:hypothetical protein